MVAVTSLLPYWDGELKTDLRLKLAMNFACDCVSLASSSKKLSPQGIGEPKALPLDILLTLLSVYLLGVTPKDVGFVSGDRRGVEALEGDRVR